MDYFNNQVRIVKEDVYYAHIIKAIQRLQLAVVVNDGAILISQENWNYLVTDIFEPDNTEINISSLIFYADLILLYWREKILEVSKKDILKLEKLKNECNRIKLSGHVDLSLQVIQQRLNFSFKFYRKLPLTVEELICIFEVAVKKPTVEKYFSSNRRMLSLLRSAVAAKEGESAEEIFNHSPIVAKETSIDQLAVKVKETYNDMQMLQKKTSKITISKQHPFQNNKSKLAENFSSFASWASQWNRANTPFKNDESYQAWLVEETAASKKIAELAYQAKLTGKKLSIFGSETLGYMFCYWHKMPRKWKTDELVAALRKEQHESRNRRNFYHALSWNKTIIKYYWYGQELLKKCEDYTAPNFNRLKQAINTQLQCLDDCTQFLAGSSMMQNNYDLLNIHDAEIQIKNYNRHIDKLMDLCVELEAQLPENTASLTCLS